MVDVVAVAAVAVIAVYHFVAETYGRCVPHLLPTALPVGKRR